MFCSNCGKEIDNKAVMCPRCKKMLNNNIETKDDGKALKIFCIIFFGVLLFFSCSMIGSSQKETVAGTIVEQEQISFTQNKMVENQQEAKKDACIPITRDIFNKITVGSSVKQLEKYCGELTSEMDIMGMNTAVITLHGNSFGSTAIFTIQNGRIDSKTQYGLR